MRVLTEPVREIYRLSCSIGVHWQSCGVQGAGCTGIPQLYHVSHLSLQLLLSLPPNSINPSPSCLQPQCAKCSIVPYIIAFSHNLSSNDTYSYVILLISNVTKIKLGLNQYFSKETLFLYIYPPLA